MTMKAAGPESDFFQRVWDVVAEIPHGRVTTYGHIAKHLGMRSTAGGCWSLAVLASLLPSQC